jgi:hypothetical protein
MRWGKIAFLGLIIAVGLTAYAVGAGSGSSKTVVFCAAKKDGDVSFAGSGKCAKGEKKIAIAKQGPPGAVGPQGLVGPAGTSPALEAAHFVSPAIVACAVQTGSYCVTENGQCWDNANAGGGLAPVSFRKDSNGFVHLEGAFTNLNTSGACGSDETRPVFYLPQGFRPAGGSERFTAPKCTGSTATGLIVIETNGLVSEAGECLDASGIVFHGDS